MAKRQGCVILILCWLSATLPVLIQAQSLKDKESEIQQTGIAVTRLPYTSVFDQYHGYDELESGSWREANDVVGQNSRSAFPAAMLGPTDESEGIETPGMAKEVAPTASFPDRKTSHNHNHEAKP